MKNPGTLLILGAGIYQVPLIRRARAMGCRTIVLSRAGAYPGFREADRSFEVDTIDVDAVLAIARQERIRGVCTTGTDVALKSLGRVAEELGLPGPSAHAAMLATDKFEMRNAWASAGVRMPRFRRVRTREEALDACRVLGFPAMIKAVDSSGSRGITKIEHEERLEHAVNRVRATTRMPYFLVEEFIDGTDFGAEAFVSGGELRMVIPTGCLVFTGDANVPLGHYLPHESADRVLPDVVDQLGRCVAAMGLDHCAINADMLLVDGRAYLIEIGARAGATGLPELVSLHTGCDYYVQILRAALGEEPVWSQPGPVACASQLLTVPRDGRILEQADRNRPGEDLVDVSFDHAVGDAVRAFRVGPDRVGQVIVRGWTLAEALASLRERVHNVHIVVGD